MDCSGGHHSSRGCCFDYSIAHSAISYWLGFRLLNKNTIHRCYELYPHLRGDKDVLRIFENSSLVTLSENSTVFSQGDACQNFMLILSGSIRVFSRSETGREALLYRVRPGDTCVLTTSCLLGGRSYPAEGITESATEAAAIPYSLFQDLMKKSNNFQEYVFGSFGRRLVDLISLIEGMHSGTIQARLARILLEKSEDSIVVKITHQELAFELGSAREVVSRQLKAMEKSGYLKLSRGAIHLQDLAALDIISSPL